MAAIAFLIAFMLGFNPAPTPGGPDHDTLFGGRGDDQLYVDDGNFADAGAGGDFVSGTKDHTLRGGDGDDLIWLNGGDQGRGGEGNDTITAGYSAFGNADPVLSTGSTADGTGTVLLINGIEVAAFQGVTSLDTSTVVILRAA